MEEELRELLRKTHVTTSPKAVAYRDNIANSDGRNSGALTRYLPNDIAPLGLPWPTSLNQALGSRNSIITRPIMLSPFRPSTSFQCHLLRISGFTRPFALSTLHACSETPYTAPTMQVVQLNVGFRTKCASLILRKQFGTYSCFVGMHNLP